jgi:hypothetical protein
MLLLTALTAETHAAEGLTSRWCNKRVFYNYLFRDIQTSRIQIERETNFVFKNIKT